LRQSYRSGMLILAESDGSLIGGGSPIYSINSHTRTQ